MNFPNEGRLGEFYVSRNDRIVNAIRKMRAYVFDDLVGQAGALIIHGKHDPVQNQLGVQGILNELDYLHQLGKTFKGIVFGLQCDHHPGSQRRAR